MSEGVSLKNSSCMWWNIGETFLNFYGQSSAFASSLKNLWHRPVFIFRQCPLPLDLLQLKIEYPLSSDSSVVLNSSLSLKINPNIFASSTDANVLSNNINSDLESLCDWLIYKWANQGKDQTVFTIIVINYCNQTLVLISSRLLILQAYLK